jgi:hypothetical protein
MLKEAGAKLPATKKAPANPTKATGVRNIPISPAIPAQQLRKQRDDIFDVPAFFRRSEE